MKKVTKFAKGIALTCLCLAAYAASGQFKPAIVPEYNYPPIPPLVITDPVGTTAHTFDYSLQTAWISISTPQEWLLVNSWDDPASLAGFAWQCVDPSTFAILDKGYINYPAGAQDLNVAIQNVTGSVTGVQVDVSYYMAGAGHFVDIYDWDVPSSLGGTGLGCLWNSTIQLSNIAWHTRISMDAHNSYGIGIVWDDPANGINIIAAQQNHFGPPFTLSGTFGYAQPDVAFTHSPVPAPLPQLHIACYNPYVGIRTSYVDWGTIIPGGTYAMSCGTPPPFTTCPLPNTVEDINPAFYFDGDIKLHIDAPDHYLVDNWAYTYTNGTDVYTRLMNYNAGAPPMISYGGTPGTICLTNGSYPISFLPAINGSGNDMPTIGWDANQAPGAGSFYVGWETGFSDPGYNPGSNAYVSIQIRENGFLMNPSLPFYFMGVCDYPGQISNTPSVSFSKQNDRSPELYTTFAQFDPTITNYEIANKYVPWSGGSFKMNPTAVHEAESGNEVSVYPNPFRDYLALDIPASMQNNTISVKVTDLYGKELGSFEDKADVVNSRLAGVVHSLIPGNYFVSVNIKASNYQKAFKVTRME